MPPTKKSQKKVSTAIISSSNEDLDSKPRTTVIEEYSPKQTEKSKNGELNTVLLEKRSTRPILSRSAKSKVGKYTHENDKEGSAEIETNIKKRKTSSKEPKIAAKLPSKNSKGSVQNNIPKKKLKLDDAVNVEETQEQTESEKSDENTNEIISTESVKRVQKGKTKKPLSKVEAGDELSKNKNDKATKAAKKTVKQNEIVIGSEASKHENVLSKNEDTNEIENITEKVVVKGKIKKIVKEANIKSDTNIKHTDNNFQKEVIETKKAEEEEAADIETKSVTEKPDVDDFDSEKPSNFKITSWNISGLRAWIKKVELGYFTKENADIICFQEIKCSEDQVPAEARLPGYHPYWLGSSTGKGGVAIYSKRMPLNVEYGIGDSELDSESRIITAEYNKFYLINVYVPNAGRKLVTLPKRLKWNILFEKFIENLNKKKPVIICGDMNVAHEEIDLSNPKTNKRNAGFTQEERDGMSNMLSLGFVDTFRNFYPNLEQAYTFWTYMKNARAKNIGWRLDYFIVSERFLSKVVDNKIRSRIMGSDHCPITLFLNV